MRYVVLWITYAVATVLASLTLIEFNAHSAFLQLWGAAMMGVACWFTDEK